MAFLVMDQMAHKLHEVIHLSWVREIVRSYEVC